MRDALANGRNNEPQLSLPRANIRVSIDEYFRRIAWRTFHTSLSQELMHQAKRQMSRDR
jgi:hypothetical protein